MNEAMVVQRLAGLVGELAKLPSQVGDDVDRVDVIAALGKLKAAAAAARDAPIRHLDHIQPHADGGPTTPTNGRGLCERGNYVHQMPGWRTTVIDSAGHLVETTTPTGHRYRSSAPAAPGTHRQRVPT